MIGRWFFMFIGVFFSITPAIVYLVAGTQIIHNPAGAPISLGGIVAFTTLQSRLFFPIGQLLNIQVDVQGALALFDRIFEYLDLPIEIKDKPKALQLKANDVRGEIYFKDVSFTYKNDDYRLLKASSRPVQNGNGSEKDGISTEPVDDVTDK